MPPVAGLTNTAPGRVNGMLLLATVPERRLGDELDVVAAARLEVEQVLDRPWSAAGSAPSVMLAVRWLSTEPSPYRRYTVVARFAVSTMPRTRTVLGPSTSTSPAVMRG